MPITISGSTGIAGVDGSASTPAVQGTDTNTGIVFPAADTVAVATNGTEQMRVDSSGNVGIGTTPSQKLQVAGNVMVGTTSAGAALMLQNATTYWTLEQSTSNFLIANTGTERMRIDSSGNVGIGTSSPGQKLEVAGSGMFKTGTNDFVHVFSDSGAMELCRAAGEAYIDLKSAASEDWDVRLQSIGTGGTFAIYTNGGERARIDTSGNFMIGRNNTDFTNNSYAGALFLPTQGLTLSKTSSTNLGACLYMNRATVGDGNLVEFAENAVLEGSISVSGTTVSYNGGHLSRWSQLPSGQRDPALLKGTVLSNLDEMCVWLDEQGAPQPNEQLNKMKISDVEGDPNVAGVFVNWDNDDQTYTDDMNVAMTGDMIIRIAQGVVVQKGDLLMSAGDGTAKPQGDDIRRSKTVAKVTSNHVTCTYADGSYCVPCVLMAC